MDFQRTNMDAHCLAVASATTPLLGIRFDDLKWGISCLVSVFGSAVALYIFRANTRKQSEAITRYQAVERLRRPRTFEQPPTRSE